MGVSGPGGGGCCPDVGPGEGQGCPRGGGAGWVRGSLCLDGHRGQVDWMGVQGWAHRKPGLLCCVGTSSDVLAPALTSTEAPIKLCFGIKFNPVSSCPAPRHLAYHAVRRRCVAALRPGPSRPGTRQACTPACWTPCSRGASRGHCPSRRRWGLVSMRRGKRGCKHRGGCLQSASGEWECVRNMPGWQHWSGWVVDNASVFDVGTVPSHTVTLCPVPPPPGVPSSVS